MLFLGVLLLVVRNHLGPALVNALVESEAVKPAGLQAWNIATTVLHDSTITVLVLGAVSLLAAWVSGPTRPAVAIRRFASPAMHRPELVYGVYAFVLLLLLLWGPTRSTRNVITVVVLFGLATIGLEVLRRQIVREYPDAEGPDVWGRLAALGGGALARVRAGRHANEPPQPPPDPGAAP